MSGDTWGPCAKCGAYWEDSGVPVHLNVCPNCETPNPPHADRPVTPDPETCEACDALNVEELPDGREHCLHHRALALAAFADGLPHRYEGDWGIPSLIREQDALLARVTAERDEAVGLLRDSLPYIAGGGYENPKVAPEHRIGNRIRDLLARMKGEPK